MSKNFNKKYFELKKKGLSESRLHYLIKDNYGNYTGYTGEDIWDRLTEDEQIAILERCYYEGKRSDKAHIFAIATFFLSPIIFWILGWGGAFEIQLFAYIGAASTVHFIYLNTL